MSGAHRNPVNRPKLPGSKWTATTPVNREKHFLVIDWVRDDDGEPTDRLLIEAVISSAVRDIHWRELEDQVRWRIGWR